MIQHVSFLAPTLYAWHSLQYLDPLDLAGAILQIHFPFVN